MLPLRIGRCTISGFNRLFRASLLVGIVLAGRCSMAALESWADPGLRVSEGLTVWLDASQQNGARKAHGHAELRSGQGMDVWYDASGNRLDVGQGDLESQPKYRQEGELAFCSFDGEKTSFWRSQINRAVDDLTVFVVAAPYNNDGNYHAFLAMHANNQDDFRTGINIDLGPFRTQKFEVVNVEGCGFSGVRNLMSAGVPFRHFQRVCLRSTVGKAGTSLTFNGEPASSRDREPGQIRMDQLVIGGRYYGGPPGIRSILAGEIAEVLVYDRRLSDDEVQTVDRYLSAKYGKAQEIPEPVTPPGVTRLKVVDNPPPVQMFVPGFVVQQLPVDLPNINNVLYRDDGKLMALAYNGNVYVLSDADGDGLEDKAELFWENKGRIRAPLGLAMTLRDDPHGRGVFLPSKEEFVLVADTDGDDKADTVTTVAKGWPVFAHGVDALGVDIDRRDGSIYFGIGCQDYTNGYLVGADGKAKFTLDNERGTIVRVTPDFKSREIVATGIRFPVGIRFNYLNDLFCTDQEGATWLANGNPLDELLHVDLTKKRHYGFPPRHPRHLPDVIDEPSVFDYGPQHQSTCGLNFDEPVNGGPIFGPEWWRHDAIVTGYSRAKLFRTKLAKTGSGYVAQNQLLAAANMLLADACIAPTGSLVVAAHSGLPDWGSGPSGKGKLFRITYADKQAPIPVLVWAQTPHEVRVVFDKEVDPETLKDIAAKATIDRGQFVSAGDRFESLRPGYAVVDRQIATPRFEHKIHNVQLTPDRKMLILSTAPHSAAVNYGLILPGLGRPAEAAESGELPQRPETDLQYDLSGVEVNWQPANYAAADAASAAWIGWLPHLDLAAARTFTVGSSLHDSLWREIKQPGVFTARTQLNLNNMLRPIVQPGSTIDYEWPPEVVKVTLTSNLKLELKVDGEIVEAVEQGGENAGKWLAAKVFSAANAKPTHQLEVGLVNHTAGLEPQLSISYSTNEDPQPRALQARRMFLPWASTAKQTELVVDNRHLPELNGGNWLRGQKVFYGEQAACSKCHKIRGEGGTIGPDLSNLTQRDYASVRRDIMEPSFAINPDFVSHNITLEDGRTLTGTITNRGDLLLIGDTNGKQTTVSRDEVDSIHPAAISIMPQGLPKLLGEEKLRDLLTFLLNEPPHMPIYGLEKPPPARSIDEVNAVLAGSDLEAKTRPIHLVLVTGPKDHGLGEHDYPAWKKVWEDLLGMAAETRVTTAEEWPNADDLKTADVLVFYQQGKWNAQRAADIDAFLARGGGLVYIHFAVDGGNDAPGFAQRIGLAWRGGQSKFRHGPLDLDFAPGESHPIARNFTQLHLHDESYWNLAGAPKSTLLLATGNEENEPQPLFWTMEPGRGRVFVSIPGHYSWTFDDPLFRVLLLRGIAWAAHEPVDRFNDLVTPGARIKPAAK